MPIFEDYTAFVDGIVIDVLHYFETIEKITRLIEKKLGGHLFTRLDNKIVYLGWVKGNTEYNQAFSLEEFNRIIDPWALAYKFIRSCEDSLREVHPGDSGCGESKRIETS